MEKTWRWFGKKDPITLDMLRQIGVEGIVTALHDIPLGEVWPQERIKALREEIEAHGMRWSVVESLPVTETIKYGGADRDQQIEIYKESMCNLAAEGVKTICYNFMPILDWARTDLEYPNPDGTSNLYFNCAEFAYFDIHILKRSNAELDWNQEILEEVARLKRTLTSADERKLIENIIIKTQGFVSGNFSEHDETPVEKFREMLNLYKGIDRNQLRDNLKYFLSAIMSVCDETGINMCVHPDDPPMQILGLPRIVTCDEDIEWFLNAVPNRHNGLTFCAGSLSAGRHNDVVELAKKYATRTHFAHLRICITEPGGNFREASHLDPRLIEVTRIFENVNPDIPMRVDHAPLMLGDETKGYNAGYSFHGRMLALGMMSGIMATIKTEINRHETI